MAGYAKFSAVRLALYTADLVAGAPAALTASTTLMGDCWPDWQEVPEMADGVAPLPTLFSS